MNDLRTGARVGVYRILGLLGRGGMAAVYKAQDETIGRVVAIKVIAGELAHNPVLRERFQREASAAGAVSHPGVIAIHGFGEHEGLPYIVFEYLPGGTLADRIRKTGALPWREAATLGATLARALAAVHAAGLVHRDLKPENVLFDASGNAKLSDFGLVRGAEKARSLTRTGELLGTLAYMAPEQADSGRDVDSRADLYSLGALLYSALTGEKPFVGEGFSALKRVLVEMPKPVRAHAPGVPEPLERLVMTLLSKDPAARGEGALSVAAAFDALAQEGRSVPGGPARRSQLLPVLGAAALGAAAAVFLVTRAKAVPVVGPGIAPVATRVATAPVATGTPVAPPPGRPEGTVLLATWGTPDFVHGRGHGYLSSHGVAFLSKGSRLVSSGYDTLLRLWDADTRDMVRVFEGHAGRILSVAVSPDDRSVVSAGDEGVTIWDLERGVEVRRLVITERIGPRDQIDYDAVFSPDGATVLTAEGAEGRARLFEVATGRELAVFKMRAGIQSVAISPDGKFAVMAGSEGFFEVLDLVRRKEVGAAMGEAGRVACGIAISPDGRRVLTVAPRNRAVIWDLRTRKPVATLAGHGESVRAVAFTPDGRAVTASFDGTAALWDASTGERERVFSGSDCRLTGVAVSRDGKRIATTGTDATVRVWDVATGGELGAPKVRRSRIDGLEALADGKRAMTTSLYGPVRIFDIASGDEAPILGGGIRAATAVTPDLAHAVLWERNRLSLLDAASGRVSLLEEVKGVTVARAAFTPDGTRVLAASEVGTLKLWDVATHKAVMTLLGHPQATPDDHIQVQFVIAFPDGKRALTGANDCAIKVWDIEAGAPVATIIAHDACVGCAALMPGAKRVLSGARDGTVVITDLDLAAKILPATVAKLVPHKAAVISVAVAPDGRHALSASEDGEIRVWDLETNALVESIRLAGDVPRNVVFERDGHAFLVATERNVILRYAFDPKR